MKSVEDVSDRIRALIAVELERRLGELTQRLPHLCTYNHRQTLDVRRVVEGAHNPSYNRNTGVSGQTIGLCMLGAQRLPDGMWAVSDKGQEEGVWQGTICEDPIDAQKCPYFSHVRMRQEILADLARDLDQPEWRDAHIPELSSLLWVLDRAEPPTLNWFYRILLFFRRPKLEPLRLTTPASLWVEEVSKQ